jgi:diacylglycerol kinase family enzyme
MSARSDGTTKGRRTLVIANPIAGRGRGESAAREIADGLRRLGGEVELHMTRDRGDAVERVTAQRGEVDQVVSAAATARCARCSRASTATHTGRGRAARHRERARARPSTCRATSPGLLRDVDAARRTRLDVARVNGHLSFLVSGIGLDAAALRELERRRVGPITKWHYTRAILGALRGYREPRLQVEIDGEALDGHFGLVLISNIIHYGGLLKLSRGRKLDDGRFEVFLFRRARRRELAATALRGILSELPGGPCTMRTGAHVRVRSDEPVPYHVDGDWRGETPVEFEISRRRYRILIP